MRMVSFTEYHYHQCSCKIELKYKIILTTLITKVITFTNRGAKARELDGFFLFLQNLIVSKASIHTSSLSNKRPKTLFDGDQLKL